MPYVRLVIQLRCLHIFHLSLRSLSLHAFHGLCPGLVRASVWRGDYGCTVFLFSPLIFSFCFPLPSLEAQGLRAYSWISLSHWCTSIVLVGFLVWLGAFLLIFLIVAMFAWGTLMVPCRPGIGIGSGALTRLFPGIVGMLVCQLFLFWTCVYWAWCVPFTTVSIVMRVSVQVQGTFLWIL